MRVGGKAVLPGVVSKNEDGIRACCAALIGQEKPPHHRLRAQHRKVVAADHMHIDSFGGFALAAHLDSRLQIGHDSGKSPRHLWKITAASLGRALKVQKILTRERNQ